MVTMTAGGDGLSRADQLDPFAALGEWAACEIRKRREAAGMRQSDLGRILAVSAQQVSHLETGRRSLRLEQARRLDVLWNTDGLFAKLWTHIQREHDREWFRKYTAYERRAREIKIWQPLVVPGLLQTSDYARALVRSAHIPDVDLVVESRIRRQEIVNREDPPIITVLVDERALRQPVPGVSLMREQLKQVAEVAGLPNVTLQIVPALARAHIGLDGGFVILDLGGAEGRLAFVEAQLTGRLVRDEDEVRTLAVRYDRIRAKALSDDDSLDLVATIMEEMR